MQSEIYNPKNGYKIEFKYKKHKKNPMTQVHIMIDKRSYEEQKKFCQDFLKKLDNDQKCRPNNLILPPQNNEIQKENTLQESFQHVGGVEIKQYDYTMNFMGIQSLEGLTRVQQIFELRDEAEKIVTSILKKLPPIKQEKVKKTMKQGESQKLKNVKGQKIKFTFNSPNMITNTKQRQRVQFANTNINIDRLIYLQVNLLIQERKKFCKKNREKRDIRKNFLTQMKQKALFV